MTEPWIRTPVPACRCPYCDHELFAASGLGRGPQPGDVSVCIRCASSLIFDQDLTVRAMEPKDWDALDEDLKEVLRLYQRGVRSLDRR